MYKISEVAEITGISTRTIRYYDEIGLFKPNKLMENGYRLYTSEDIDLLQQILFYKTLGLELKDIKEIISDENFDLEQSLETTLKNFKEQKIEVEKIIQNIEKSLKNLRGEVEMSKEEKFEIFKQGMLDENEEKYGEEMRKNPTQYDPEMVRYSRDKVKYMTKDEYDGIEKLGKDIIDLLEKHVNDVEFDEEIAKSIYEKHREWLVFYWGKYVKEAHRGVCDMYINDERFTAYYDNGIEGCAEFLRKCVYFCTDEKH